MDFSPDKIQKPSTSLYMLQVSFSSISSVHHSDKEDTPSRHLGVDDIPARKGALHACETETEMT